MPGESPHITLAILTRNRPNDLQRALAAAYGGDEVPSDVLVSDDSSDEMRPMVRCLVERYPGARYTAGPRTGLGANENHVVSALLPDAEWVAFIGDDARLSTTYLGEMRRLLAMRHYHTIPSGIEIRNGVRVEPNRLSFLGFQSRRYPSYEVGRPLETVVVQATAWPVALLREVRWLEVSSYGYDEVDMAAKARRAGWQIRFEPSVWLYHDQSPVGRDEYPAAVEIARLYVRLRMFSVYARRPLHLVAFAVVAPVHLLLSRLRRGGPQPFTTTLRVSLVAFRSWLSSLRGNWRLG